jgi:hypothetical protein
MAPLPLFFIFTPFGAEWQVTVDSDVVLTIWPTLTDQVLFTPPSGQICIGDDSQDNRASPIKGPSCLLRRLKSTKRLDSSCSFAEVWWVAYRGRAVVDRKTSYTSARSNPKLHTLWCRLRLVDGLVERSKRTSVKSLYAWCAISSIDYLKILPFMYMCILHLYYFSAFQSS